MLVLYLFIFFFNDTATTEIYTLSLHDALPISAVPGAGRPAVLVPGHRLGVGRGVPAGAVGVRREGARLAIARRVDGRALRLRGAGERPAGRHGRHRRQRPGSRPYRPTTIAVMTPGGPYGPITAPPPSGPVTAPPPSGPVTAPPPSGPVTAPFA